MDDLGKLRSTFFVNLGVHPLLAASMAAALAVLWSKQVRDPYLPVSRALYRIAVGRRQKGGSEKAICRWH